MIIAIQGIEGSYHHQAVVRYYNDSNVEIIGKDNFSDVFEALEKNEVDIGCIAIENSIYGSIYENYDLLNKSGFHIIGELFLKIQHNLIVNPGTKEEDIKQVLSHPVAIRQCQKFLESTTYEVLNREDTSKSVKEIKDNKMIDSAAIASSIAAELFDMEILKSAIQDFENNYTRFLFLSKENEVVDFDKLSINFQVKNKPGSLLSIMQIINNNGGNMSKIESRPILGQVWQYQFYVDIIIDQNNYEKLITELKQGTQEFTLLGTYKQGKFIG